MNTDNLYGPVKLKDEEGREICYRKMTTGQWLARDAKSYVWREIDELPEALGKLAQGFLN